MRIVDDFDQTPPFEVFEPRYVTGAQAAPVVFNSPHSGRCYPFSFLASSRLDHNRIRISEDAYVDRLFDDVVEQGAPLMLAHFPRAYIDLNREPYELDPRMFTGRLPTFANVRSVRVASGLGTIPKVVAEAEDIYAYPLPIEEAIDRINTLYKPYHARLRRLLAEVHVAHGAVLLVDCHSMPSVIRGQDPNTKCDIALGDRFGTSCPSAIVQQAGRLLRAMGYSVGLNKPYAGGFITEHYGRPSRGLYALQLEISRGLYLNEKSLELTSGFLTLKRDLALFSAEMIAFTADFIHGHKTAAAAE